MYISEQDEKSENDEEAITTLEPPPPPPLLSQGEPADGKICYRLYMSLKHYGTLLLSSSALLIFIPLNPWPEVR